MVKVLTWGTCCEASPTTALESSPPLRQTPRGTSLRKCTRTASSSDWRSVSHGWSRAPSRLALSAAARVGRSQYGRCSTLWPRSTRFVAAVDQPCGDVRRDRRLIRAHGFAHLAQVGDDGLDL